jgi:hypothetical protein
MPGTRGHERNTDSIRETSPRIRHVDGGGLVARVHQDRAAAHRGVEDGEDLVAGQREDSVHAARKQRLDEAPGAGYFTISSSSTSKTSVAPGRIVGGAPRSP